jgi:CheY-like chemotaxis protein
MKNPEHGEPSQQAMRLAQLEIKMLREQLLKAIDEAQEAREQAQKMAARISAAPPVSSLPNESPKVLPDDANGKLPNESSDGSPEKSPEISAIAPAPPDSNRVLCIEDSEANYQLIEAILNDRPGTNLTWASSGEKGLNLALSHKPQLVLLDLDLPDMHGSQVLAQLRNQPEMTQTPVIVISADATPSQIERMLAAGARDYITKPFEIRRFLLMFDEIFPRK